MDRLQALNDRHQQESNRLEAHEASGHRLLVKVVHAHLDWLGQPIDDLERTINGHIDRPPDLKGDAELLHSIPGIGTATVAKVLAYAGDVRRVANALAAFIGVTPRQRVSGSSVNGRTMMSRTGHADLRRALYMPGLVARRHHPVLKVFGDRRRVTGLAPKAVVGAVMRKLAHLIYGVIKSGQPFDANFTRARLDFQDGI
ncbi:MAG: transposase [Nitrospirota bacterium]